MFEVQKDGALRRFGGHAPTRDSDCLQKVWSALAPQGIDPRSVRRLYSEWELSVEDKRFAVQTFPAAQMSYSFSRPRDDQWDTAMAAASKTMEAAARKPPSPQPGIIELPSGGSASSTTMLAAPAKPVPTKQRPWWRFW